MTRYVGDENLRVRQIFSAMALKVIREGIKQPDGTYILTFPNITPEEEVILGEAGRLAINITGDNITIHLRVNQEPSTEPLQ